MQGGHSSGESASVRQDLLQPSRKDTSPHRSRVILRTCVRIRIKVKIQKLQRLKMEPWMLTNGGLEAQNGP